MKALSLWQPWASAIAIGAKRIETRCWFTHYRGLLLIHAAARGPKSRVADWIDVLGLDLDVDNIPFGALVAVAQLDDCRHAENLEPSELEQLLGDFSPGRFGWMLSNVRVFEQPIPYRGRQRLFSVPDDLVADAIHSARRVT